MKLPRLLCGFALLLCASFAYADGPADNNPDNVKPVPPKGNDIPAADKEEIQKGLAELQKLIAEIGKHDLLPDVAIYEKGVRWALDYNEIYDGKGKPGGAVKATLKAGLERAKLLKEGKTPWTTQTGPVLRAYKSKIDGSYQPYWINVPKDYEFVIKEPKEAPKHRLDFWWRGRSETGSEAAFCAGPQGASGIITAPGAFVLFPLGRFCNANKFAGEVDSFECLDHAKKFYRIDDSRIVARGFSMGGAACWQYAAHFPGFFCAAAPGAGFAETKEFLGSFQKEIVKPTWYEEKLWGMYDATKYSQNIFNIPTVAYSGEIDSQKQAADIMAREMKKVGLELTHIIGPKTGHGYEKAAKEEVNKLIDAIVAKGKPADRKEIKFVTNTLRYNKCDWIEIEGLDKHWEQAKVICDVKDRTMTIKTENVAKMSLSTSKAAGTLHDEIIIDGIKLVLTPILSPPPYEKIRFSYEKKSGKWQQASKEKPDALAKTPGLQGPIDDAFMDAFLMVAPTGTPMNEKIGAWTQTEMKHATDHWRKQFRGDAPMKKDSEITDDDIKNNNLILWGDPKSNAILAKIADKLPLKEFGDTTVTACIFPNPLNPKKYVVLNSGFTFREYDYLNNARQVSKLPDYAVIDVSTPANSRWPGKIVRAGFFDEQWKLQKDDGK
jgi:hypothetical protein